MGEICEKEVYLMRDMRKRFMSWERYVRKEICEKEVYVMGERGLCDGRKRFM